MTSIASRGLAAAALLALAAPTAHAQLGIAVGANFDSITDVDRGSAEAAYKSATGYHIGATYSLSLGPIGVRPGIFYSDISAFEPEAGTDNLERVDLDLIEVPIDVTLGVGAFPLARPYVLAGPVFRFAQTSDDDDTYEKEDFTVAAAAGAGVEVNALGFRPYAELRYQFGLQKFASEIRGVPTDGGGRVNSFMVRLGLTF